MLTLRSDLRKTLLDVLHQDEIEIVSPSFVNRREYDEQKSFIPQTIQQKSEELSSKSTVEELAFDKAEEAESIEKFKEDYNDLLKKEEELSEKMKEENDKERKKEMEDEIQHLTIVALFRKTIHDENIKIMIQITRSFSHLAFSIG
jgi:small conductance mechanosensitive channel